MVENTKKSIEYTEKITEMLKEGYTQDNIANELGMSQSQISRDIKKYKLNPKNTIPLSELLHGLEITSPSVLYISVPVGKRNVLVNKLMDEYGETEERYGIVAIQEIKEPSGLIIFSNNHNLLQELLSIANQ